MHETMTLTEYLNNTLVVEGGAGGHMKHIYDYDELTLDNLKGIIFSLFNGRIVPTEKIDGTNIQASMNNVGDVVFIRNKKDLNSDRGGMSVQDMVEKWKGNEKVQRTFVESGKIIEELFNRVGKRFFNPDPSTSIFANCECMTEGTTNIMPYVQSKVFIHDLWVYQYNGKEWEHVDTTKDGLRTLNKEMKDMDTIAITPEVIVHVTEEGKAIMNKYFKELNQAFKDVRMGNRNTVKEYKQERFVEWVKDNAPWLEENEEGMLAMYDRIVDGVKTVNIRLLKQMYPQHEVEVGTFEKDRGADVKRYVSSVLDDIFLRLSNSIINLCSGFVNDGEEERVLAQLNSELENTVKEIKGGADTKEQSITKLLNELNRLGSERLNATEGIVFVHKGRLMKCTGSFAPLNQILSSLKYNR